MAAVTGAVVVEAAGQSHVIQFTTNRLVLLEERTGKGPVALTYELNFDPTFGLIRAMLWAGLGGTDRTLADVGDLIDAIGRQQAIEAVKDAWRAAFPEPERDQEGGDDRPLVAAAG